MMTMTMMTMTMTMTMTMMMMMMMIDRIHFSVSWMVSTISSGDRIPG